MISPIVGVIFDVISENTIKMRMPVITGQKIANTTQNANVVPIAGVRRLKNVDIMTPIQKKTTPSSIVAPMNIAYSPKSALGIFRATIMPPSPNPMTIEYMRIKPRPMTFPRRISNRFTAWLPKSSKEPVSISPTIAVYPSIRPMIGISIVTIGENPVVIKCPTFSNDCVMVPE